VFVYWFSYVYQDKKDHLEVLVKSFRSVMDSHVKDSSHFLILSVNRLNKLVIQTQSNKLISDLSKDIRNSFSEDEKETDSQCINFLKRMKAKDSEGNVITAYEKIIQIYNNPNKKI
jgi:translation initiation factor 2 beta subunit (eIF-2beta)/eIF-5